LKKVVFFKNESVESAGYKPFLQAPPQTPQTPKSHQSPPNSQQIPPTNTTKPLPQAPPDSQQIPKKGRKKKLKKIQKKVVFFRIESVESFGSSAPEFEFCRLVPIAGHPNPYKPFT
jgi:hypothetical protein